MNLLLVAAIGLAATPALAHRNAPLPPVPNRVIERGDLYAYQAHSRARLLPGRRSKGRAGDFVIGNRFARFVIGGFRKTPGFPDFTGYLLDAGRAGEPGDLLGASRTLLQRGGLRLRPRYHSVVLVSDGSNGQAIIRASGDTRRWPWLKLITEYRIGAKDEFLTIRTTVRNEGRKAISFWIGDYLKWSNARTFFPGRGFRLRRGKAVHRASWIARRGQGSSFGWFVARGRFILRVVPHHQGSRYNSAMKILSKRTRLAPGETVVHDRGLAVGKGDIADIARIVHAAQNLAGRNVSGTVFERGTRAPQAGARVRAYRGRVLASEADTDERGRFTLWLRPGTYRIVAWGWARPRGRSRKVVVRESHVANVDLELRPAGRIRFAITDEVTGKPIPGRLILIGVGGTRTPRFASERENRVFYVDNVIHSHTGSGEQTMPPGRYRVLVTRGPEYTLVRTRLTVRSGETAQLSAKLRRVVDTKGAVACDFHVHSINSQDSLVGLEQRVRSLVSENVEVAVGTDHNHVTDYRPVVRRLGLGRFIQTIPGDEVTTKGFILGHFNVFPVEPEAGTPGEGALAYFLRSPQDIFAEARSRPGPPRLIQVNHPRLGRKNGYFNQVRWNGWRGVARDRRYSPAYDALEVFNGLDRSMGRTRWVLREWFSLLNLGYRYTATGNSDSHRLTFEEVGYPRNFVSVSDDRPDRVDPDEIVSAVKAGRVVVTNGPFLRVRAVALGADKRPAPGLKTIAGVPKRREKGAAWFPRPPVGSRATGGLGDLVRVGPGGVGLDVQVQAAPWIDIQRVDVVGNGRLVKTLRVSQRQVPVRFDRTIRLRPRKDTWYVVMVWGRGSIPTIPRPGIRPLAFANPIWVDADNNGSFTPLRRRRGKRRASRTRRRRGRRHRRRRRPAGSRSSLLGRARSRRVAGHTPRQRRRRPAP